MKVNTVICILIVAFSLLLGYWVYTASGDNPNATLAGLISSICFAIPLLLGVGISYSTDTCTINQRTLGVIAFVIMIITQSYFAYTGVTMPYYVILNGILMCVYAAIAYSVYKSKQ